LYVVASASPWYRAGVASVIYKEYQAGFYGLSTAGNVVLFILVTAIVYPLMRFFNRLELEL
jgi:raffinose/stachyose/melibiose transport system permease protein